MNCASNFVLFKKQKKAEEIKEAEDKWEVNSDELNRSFDSDEECEEDGEINDCIGDMDAGIGGLPLIAPVPAPSSHAIGVMRGLGGGRGGGGGGGSRGGKGGRGGGGQFGASRASTLNQSKALPGAARRLKTEATFDGKGEFYF